MSGGAYSAFLTWSGEEFFWNHIYRHSGEHRIADEVELVIEVLEARKAFVHELCVQEGSVQIYLQLPGDVNLGGVLPWELMTRAASLRVELGLEVFPNFK